MINKKILLLFFLSVILIAIGEIFTLFGIFYFFQYPNINQIFYYFGMFILAIGFFILIIIVRKFNSYINRQWVLAVIVYFGSIFLAGISIKLSLPALNSIYVYLGIIVLPYVFGLIFVFIIAKNFIDTSTNFIKRWLIDYVAKDYNEDGIKHWPRMYLLSSYVYLAIFFIYFYYIPHDNLFEPLFISWISLIFLRFIHYLGNVQVTVRIAKIIIEFLFPFGIILYIYFYMFTLHLQSLLDINMILIYKILICFSFSTFFIFSNLGSEIIFSEIRKYRLSRK